MTQNFIFGNLTDIGLVRKANEDYYGCFDTLNGYVFVICDGMGGHIGGALASQIAVQSIKNYFESEIFENIIISLHNSLVNANDAILQKVESDPELEGMGTTAIIVLIKDDAVYYAHIGDSRIYYHHDNNLYRITSDHSFVQNLVDKGFIADHEAEKHPRKNEITKALGITTIVEPAICNIPLTPVENDIILLCSDGLTGMVNEDLMRDILNDQNSSVQDKVSILIEEAKKQGGLDNITVQIIQFNKTGNNYSNFKPLIIKQKKNTTSKRKKKFNSIKLILIFLVPLFLLILYFSEFNQPSSEKLSVAAVDSTAHITNKGIGKKSKIKEQIMQAEEFDSEYYKYDHHKLNDNSSSTFEILQQKKENHQNQTPYVLFGYKILKGDNSNVMEKKFGKSWVKLKQDDVDYKAETPQQETILRIKVQEIFNYNEEDSIEIRKMAFQKAGTKKDLVKIIKEQKAIIILQK